MNIEVYSNGMSDGWHHGMSGLGDTCFDAMMTQVDCSDPTAVTSNTIPTGQPVAYTPSSFQTLVPSTMAAPNWGLLALVAGGLVLFTLRK